MGPRYWVEAWWVFTHHERQRHGTIRISFLRAKESRQDNGEGAVRGGDVPETSFKLCEIAILLTL